MSDFDPLDFNFIRLGDFEFPGGVQVFEYRSHSTIDGTYNYLRLNYYMSKESSYVTIWYGLLEPMGTRMEMTTGKLATVDRPPDFEFLDSYSEELFKGHFDSSEAAGYIMKALRIGERGGRGGFPQILRAGNDNKLRCDALLVEDQ